MFACYSVLSSLSKASLKFKLCILLSKDIELRVQYNCLKIELSFHLAIYILEKKLIYTHLSQVGFSVKSVQLIMS